MIIKKSDILQILQVAIKAGNLIVKIYERDFDVEYKADNSPLTEADRASNEIITSELKRLFPNIPLLSEESKEILYDERKEWEYFWLIDPLDGTKEFIKRNGEFTVNIALVQKCKPVFGIIYVPVKDTLYFGHEATGSYKLQECNRLNSCENIIDLTAIAQKLPLNINDRPFTVVGSRSHMSDETMEFIREKEAEHGKIEILSTGSSLKLCMVAEGKADIYPRFGPTMEWDTAAGHAIVELANGKVTETKNNKPLDYNKENLLNPWFIVQR